VPRLEWWPTFFEQHEANGTVGLPAAASVPTSGLTEGYHSAGGVRARRGPDAELDRRQRRGQNTALVVEVQG